MCVAVRCKTFILYNNYQLILVQEQGEATCLSGSDHHLDQSTISWVHFPLGFYTSLFLVFIFTIYNSHEIMMNGFISF